VSGTRRNAPADFSQQLPTARRIAALLSRHKAGFGLPLGDDVRDKVCQKAVAHRCPWIALRQARLCAANHHNDKEWFSFYDFQMSRWCHHARRGKSKFAPAEIARIVFDQMFHAAGYWTFGATK
jgi:hypothetical protein